MWSLLGEEQHQSPGNGWREIPVNKPTWELEDEAAQTAAAEGTEQAARHSMAGSSQGLSARTSQGLEVMIPETCLQSFCSRGF